MSRRHKGEFDDEEVEAATEALGKEPDEDQLQRFADEDDSHLQWEDEGEQLGDKNKPGRPPEGSRGRG